MVRIAYRAKSSNNRAPTRRSGRLQYLRCQPAAAYRIGRSGARLSMRPPGGRSASVRSGWCHSPTGRSRRSAMRRVGAAMDHLVDCPAPVRAESRFADGGLVTAATVLAPGQKLRVIKFGGSTPRDTSPGIRRVPASKATPPRASASRSPCGQCGHIDVARMSSRSPRYSPPQPTRPGQ